ncbi:MAG: V-type ATP synthase subunit E, partial [Candidatus Anstonellales archaeon]
HRLPKLMNAGEMKKELAELLNTLEKRAEQEVKELLQKIEKEHIERIKQIEENFEKELAKIDEELKQLKAQELVEKKALLQLEMKRAINSAREKAVENAIIDLRNLIIKERTHKLKELYVNFLLQKIREHSKEFSEFKIVCGEIEYEILHNYREFSDKLVPKKTMSGFIILSSDEKIGYDYTIDSILEAKKETLKVKIYKLLFGIN